MQRKKIGIKDGLEVSLENEGKCTTRFHIHCLFQFYEIHATLALEARDIPEHNQNLQVCTSTTHEQLPHGRECVQRQLFLFLRVYWYLKQRYWQNGERWYGGVFSIVKKPKVLASYWSVRDMLLDSRVRRFDKELEVSDSTAKKVAWKCKHEGE